MSDDYAGPGVPTFGPPPHYHVPSIKGLPGSECAVCGQGFLSGIHTMPSAPEIPPLPDDRELAEFWHMCAEVMRPRPLEPAVTCLKAAISIQVSMRAEIERLRALCGEPVASAQEALEVFQYFLRLNQ